MSRSAGAVVHSIDQLAAGTRLIVGVRRARSALTALLRGIGERRLDLVAGLADGTLTALTLTAGRLLGHSDGVTLDLAFPGRDRYRRLGALYYVRCALRRCPR